MRRSLLIVSVLLLPLALAQDTHYHIEGEQISGPANPADFSAWLADISQWRVERLIRAGFDDSQYARPELQWAQRNFVQPQMMVEDRYFYDPVAGKYTVDRYLDDVTKRYGGIDSVLIWHVYPNIGIDNRSQYDLLRDMPGGLAGVRQMVEDFHRHGVKVFFPAMPWDRGSHDEGMPMWDATARIMAEVNADGINGDTFGGIPRAFRVASDKTGHPLVFEPEGAPDDEALAWNNQSWGYWKYPSVPMISKQKWLERRHMVNVCDRWAHDHNDDLQSAFFNGVGFESWENIWGIWNQMTPRDAEALRHIAVVDRKLGDLLVSSDWEPHTPTLQYGIYASKFPGQTETLWTFINRNEYDVTGRQIRIPYRQGISYFDLWHGLELTPEIEKSGNEQTAVFRFAVGAHGYGALLATSRPDEFKAFAAQIETAFRRPLSEFSNLWHPLPQQQTAIQATQKPPSAPEGMILIPAANFTFNVSGVEIEGDNGVGVDVQYPWENEARRHHDHVVPVKAFYIDKYPVTNADFKKFLDASHYQPKDSHNFLKDWVNGTFPQGWANEPVTWVSLEDAKAYSMWARKRLPHEWEWQYAAQGTDGRLYPWGNGWNAAAVPVLDKGHDLPPASDVDAHPAGASPFGVMDMVGNIWQWTDEYTDEHTRAAILRGGSHYHSSASMWYFPEAFKLNEHGKYLLMAPSKDRAGTLGFRCVVDAE